MEMGTEKISRNGKEIPLFSELKIQVFADIETREQEELAIQELREIVGSIEDHIRLFILLPNNFRIETH